MKRAMGFMDFGLFKKIVDDAASTGVKRIWLYAQGESLLHPQIVNMIEYIKKKQLGIDLTTNGMLLDENKANAMLNAGMDSADYITFSIMGQSQEVHETIMKGVNHRTVEQNLFNLIKLRNNRRKSGPIIQTDFYIIPENQHETAAYEKYWGNIVDHALPPRPISRLFSRHGDMSQIAPRHEICTQAWERMTVFWNGDVTICNQDIQGEFVFGNLQSQSIRELWNHKTFRQFKTQHKDNKFVDLPLCNKCDAFPITHWLHSTSN
jgi:radical SAM protein with 4Fe4S-binding SPASM domain